MFQEFEDQIKSEAVSQFPKEAVWLITKVGCRMVENVSSDPTMFFEVRQQDTAKALSEGLLAVVHSHAGGLHAPSAADMRGQAGSGVPWGLVLTDGTSCSDIVWWGDSVEPQPLVGRPFRHGISDCYALVRDYFRTERGITLRDFPRDWEWWSNGQDLINDGILPAGLRPVPMSEARPGDIWIAQIRSDVPNHTGILLEGGLALHQPGSRHAYDPYKLSVREPINRYLHFITHWLRYDE